MSKLSAVIICKNEEVMIETMLKSIQWVDEVIVCDTGSTDRTIEIAKKYTDKVYSFPWVDDFQKARNYAKQFATNEWIISCDCDEEMEIWWIDKIKEIISINNEIDWIYVNMWNWASGNSNAIRVFKKELDWHWKIHECISPTNTLNSWVTIKYWRSPTHDKEPLLDLRIMEKVLEEEPYNTRNLFYLAREYYYIRDYDLSELTYKRYLSLHSPFFNEVTDAYYMLAKIYWENGKWQWELSREMLMKVLLRNINFKAAHILMAQQMIDDKKRDTWLKFAEIADNSNCLFIH